MPQSPDTGSPVLGTATLAVHALYARIGRVDIAVADFLPVALADLRRRVPCDLAYAATVDGATGAADGLRPCGPLAAGAGALLVQARAANGLRQRALGAPGRPVREPVGGDGPAAHALVIVIRDSPHGLLREVALWRRGFRSPFNDLEARWLEFVVPHVLLASRMHLSAAGRRLALPAGEAAAGFALCDPHGALLEADEGFLSPLRADHPRWPAVRLPPAYTDVLDATRADEVVGEHVAIRRVGSGTAPLLRLRRRVAADRLSATQRLIAERLAAGSSHREVAASLALSPTAVRNHTAAIYRRLGVRNRAQLLRAVRSAGPAQRGGEGERAPDPAPAGAPTRFVPTTAVLEAPSPLAEAGGP